MKILAINTSNIIANIAFLNEDNQVLKAVDSNAKNSEIMMAEIDKILEEQKVDLCSVDAFCAVVGPGSFTGIRIGVALFKGFEMVFDNIKKISVTSFELMARDFLQKNKNFKGEYICVINALSGKYYVQKFCGKMSIEKPKMVEGTPIIENEKVVVGLESEKLPFVNNFVNFTPKLLLEIAMEKFDEKNFVENFTPLYLRKSQAEDEMERKNKIE